MVSEAMKRKIDIQFKCADLSILTDNERETVELRMQYYSYEEIAKIKGVTKQSVGLQIQNSIKKITGAKIPRSKRVKSVERKTRSISFSKYLKIQLDPIKIELKLVRLGDSDPEQHLLLTQELETANQLLNTTGDVVLSEEQANILSAKKDKAERILAKAKTSKIKKERIVKPKQEKSKTGILVLDPEDHNKYVKIGKREVDLYTFKQAVSQCVKIKDICDYLGFNATVGTTRQAIKDRIDELALDTAHFKWNYTVSEAVINRNRKKQFNLSDNNQRYYDAFEEYRTSIDKTSWATYKSSVGNHMESLKDKDFAKLSIEEIIGYADSCKNSINVLAHLRSLMIFIIQNDVNGALEKAERKTLAWLITKPRE